MQTSPEATRLGEFWFLKLSLQGQDGRKARDMSLAKEFVSHGLFTLKEACQRVTDLWKTTSSVWEGSGIASPPR